jgi:hypothetical protein
MKESIVKGFKEGTKEWQAEKDRQDIIDVESAIKNLKSEGSLPRSLIEFVKIQEALLPLGYRLQGFDFSEGWISWR